MTTRHGSATVTLPSDREILITRTFEAPSALVWDALTQPRHLLRWWGPDYCPLVACDVDFRVGGAWRYICRDMDGNELGWHGTYREIDPGERIVSTEVFEGFPDAEAVNTMTLTEVDGITTLRTTVLHATTEYRDGHVASGMEGGMQISFNRLDDLLDAATTTAERFRRVAGRFTDRANEVPEGAWENPAPCDGWTARDIVDHLVTWVPGFMASSAGIVIDPGPPVAIDPAGAWINLADQIQALLDDPVVAAREFDGGPIGTQTVESAIGMIVLGDVVVHTWDLARATGLDESLDHEIVTEMLIGMRPMDEMLRQSGHYGPKVEVADDADDQTQLIAFTGRTP
jgi:uncharacterized protein (TIGR03086 family)